jgi:hypothetical protein
MIVGFCLPAEAMRGQVFELTTQTYISELNLMVSKNDFLGG